MNRVLVTGASGFVGRVLCDALTTSGYTVRALARAGPIGSGTVEHVRIDDLASVDWPAVLHDVRYVVHAAARAHAPGTAEEEYRRTNAEATQRLAQAAAAAGVARFVYLSTVKVHGEGGARAYCASDEPHAQDAYGRSKLLGEHFVLEAGEEGAMDCVIVRPPLVYGSGVRANFLRLLEWVDRGWPLPLAAVDNRRSMISVWNLCDFIGRTLTEHGAAGRAWLVSDGEDLSTPALVHRIAVALRRPARLFAVPVPLLRALGGFVGRGEQFARLCDSLTVDITPARTELAWVPPLALDAALARTVQWYRSRAAGRGSPKEVS